MSALRTWLPLVLVVGALVALVALIVIAATELDYLTYIDETGRICVRERAFSGEILREVCR